MLSTTDSNMLVTMPADLQAYVPKCELYVSLRLKWSNDSKPDSLDSIRL